MIEIGITNVSCVWFFDSNTRPTRVLVRTTVAAVKAVQSFVYLLFKGRHKVCNGELRRGPHLIFGTLTKDGARERVETDGIKSFGIFYGRAFFCDYFFTFHAHTSNTSHHTVGSYLLSRGGGGGLFQDDSKNGVHQKCMRPNGRVNSYNWRPLRALRGCFDVERADLREQRWEDFFGWNLKKKFFVLSFAVTH